ncbi:MAG: D-glycero-alpha-D-manno-heptose-1,7-bisphosphate 7-phosphatase [Anaeroplasmataceae bacterium]
MKKTLFLDRDGVINQDFGHVHTIDNFVFIDGIFDLCLKFQKQGYDIVIVTNQAGIAKGYYSLDTFLKLNNWLIGYFKTKNIDINDILYCPHSDNDDCDCRKPKAGMFLKYALNNEIDIENSIMIGDKMSDLDAAYEFGIRKLYLLKGKYELQKKVYHYTIINSLKEL